MSEQEIPQSRTYRHSTCGNDTTVGDQSFEVVSNPMSSMEQTYCSSCSAMFPISEYQWADTDETIADYYARYTQNATDRQRFLCSKKFMTGVILLTAILAGGAAFVLLANSSMLARVIGMLGGLLIGAMVGMAIFVSVFANPIKHKVCGVSDTRLLK